jgi:nucleoside 2-deoxyribosyltransferase
MKIYFACSITGGRKEEKVYQLIVDYLLSDGHLVPTAHLSGSDVMLLEEIVDPSEVYLRDIEWINDCQAMIAEVSTPSHGVGYEISYALSQSKPVLCLYSKGSRVSKMLTGNNNPGIQVLSYQHLDEIAPMIRDFLSNID